MEIEQFLDLLEDIEESKKTLYRAYLLKIKHAQEGAFLSLDQAMKEILCVESRFHETSSFRSKYYADYLAQEIITEKGDVDREKVKQLYLYFSQDKWFFSPLSFNDHLWMNQIKKILEAIQDKEFVRELSRFHFPIHNAYFTRLIEKFYMKEGITPTAALRRFILSSCFCAFRQNVGSCFATAPAILVHFEQPLVYLRDVYDLIYKGSLSRVIEGRAYSIPLSPSSGGGDLLKRRDPLSRRNKLYFSPSFLACYEETFSKNMKESLGDLLKSAKGLVEQKNDIEGNVGGFLRKLIASRDVKDRKAFSLEDKEREKEFESIFQFQTEHSLLRSWEYTLASFSEIKLEFATWNFFLSLGLKAEGGIGDVITQFFNEKIDEINLSLEKLHKEYTAAHDKMRTVEYLSKDVDSDSKAQRLKSEWQVAYHHFYSLENMLHDLQDKGKKLNEVHKQVFNFFFEVFPQYFQEVYDPLMGESNDTQRLFEDAPAGFRLLFKHGRDDPSTWALIYNEKQYTQALIEFFTAIENRLMFYFKGQIDEQILTDLITRIIHHLQEPQFIEKAYSRMAAAHQELNKGSIVAKPWSYVSGGTLTTLVKTYFKQKDELKKISRTVDSPFDLLSFLLDALKDLPFALSEEFIHNPSKSLLIHSPTHAFLLKPGFKLFQRGWLDKGLTYTWIRDEILVPSQEFYRKILLRSQEQQFLLDKFIKEYSLERLIAARPVPPFYDSSSVKEFSDTIKQYMFPAQSSILEDYLEGFLFENIPLTAKSEVRHMLSDLSLAPSIIDELEVELSSHTEPFYLLSEMLNIALSGLLKSNSSVIFPYNPLHWIRDQWSKTGKAAPFPCIVADSNWPQGFFSFVYNPAQEKLDWFVTDEVGLKGQPISSFKSSFDQGEWVLFVDPHQYTF